MDIKSILKVLADSYPEEGAVTPSAKDIKLLKNTVLDALEAIRSAEAKINKNAGEKKFLFILDRDNVDYLDWCSAYRYEHKSEIIRRALLEIRSGDKDYRDYLRNKKKS